MKQNLELIKEALVAMNRGELLKHEPTPEHKKTYYLISSEDVLELANAFCGDDYDPEDNRPSYSSVLQQINECLKPHHTVDFDEEGNGTIHNAVGMEEFLREQKEKGGSALNHVGQS